MPLVAALNDGTKALEDAFQDTHEALGTEFVQEANVPHGLEKNKELTADLAQWLECADSLLHFLHNVGTLCDLLLDLGSFPHQRFHTRHNAIVV